jgi:D-inositol-3-phosphate glycosyltransferase
MRRSAAEHAAMFSWDNTVDALLASYRRAIGEFTARRSVRNLASARRGNQARRRLSRREAWA